MNRILATMVLASSLGVLACAPAFAGHANRSDPVTEIATAVERIVTFPIRILRDLTR